MSRVLIVEDEEAIAEIEKDYLELSDFEVVIKSDGTQGLATALNEDFDIMILDVMLPGTDGYEICRQVREVKNTPIIMVSAKKEDIQRTNCLKKSGIWILSVILQPLPCISKRFVKRLSMIRQSRSILKPSGVSDIDLKCNIGYDNSLWCFAS